MTTPETTMAQIGRRMLSAKAEQFTESVIREMTRLRLETQRRQSFAGTFRISPRPPKSKKPPARRSPTTSINTRLPGARKRCATPSSRNSSAPRAFASIPSAKSPICCGSTEAMMSAMMAIINPGDEIVVFEPYYENYGPDAILSGATPRFVKMSPPKNENDVWTYDEDELAAAFGPKTKAIILNTPNNPTGKVFTRGELEFIRDLCVRWNAFCITDEIYEHILYDGTEHITMARIDGMRDRTIVINGMSKTYSVTGWRVGWAIAPPDATSSIRKVHDFLTVGAAAPLQQAGAIALKQPQSYYDKLAASYVEKRARLLKILTQAGFTVFKPRGAYYIMTDISRFPDPDPSALSGCHQGRSLLEVFSGRNRCCQRPGLQLLQRPQRRRDPSPIHVLQERRNHDRRRTTPRQASSCLAPAWINACSRLLREGGV